MFTRMPSFPPVVDGDLDTGSFLSAADGVRSFVHILGPTLFSPVTSDIGGNIEKIRLILAADPAKYATLRSIIDSEKDEPGFRIGTDACLWLTRAFDFIALFLRLWVSDYESGQRNEDISSYFKNAYDISLKRHHNWFVQKVVFVVLSGCPSREQLLLALFSPDGQTVREDPVAREEEEQLFSAINEHVQRLQSNTDCLRSLFDAVNFDWKA